MTGTLSIPERQIALLLSGRLALLGLAMAAAARHSVMAVHGAMALGLGVVLIFIVGGALYDPAPRTDRMRRYYDAPTRFGIVMTLVWALIGMSAGVWVAALLYWPGATPLWPDYAEDAEALVAVSQVVATHFATVAAANGYWTDRG